MLIKRQEINTLWHSQDNKPATHPSRQASHQLKPSHFRLLLLHHLHACSESLRNLWRTPFATTLTVLVVAIALALPTGLLVILQNVEAMAQHWHADEDISLFLKLDVPVNTHEILLDKIRSLPAITNVRYISPQQGLDEFQKQSGIEDVLAELHENPLPAVIRVTLDHTIKPHDITKTLLPQLKQIPEIDSVQLDLTWLQRFYTMINLAHKILLALATLLAMGVLLIIGNTIRLTVQNHQDEIKVIKLVGGTDTFVRRPYLYSGLFFGLLGGAIAWCLVTAFVMLLRKPVLAIAKLYASNFSLQALGLKESIALLICSAFLGMLAVTLTVRKQLQQIEPD